MATLGTQTISTSYTQLLKTFGSNIVDGTLRAISSGDEAGVSALQICTTGAKSTGTFAVDGASTFGSHLTASTGTATIGTLSVSGLSTFGSHVTMSTGTATIGTIASTTINNTGLGTTGTLQVGASGPKLTAVSFGTFAFSGGTVQTHAANDTTFGTFALPCQLGDIVIASIDSLGSTTGTGALISTNFFPIATNVVEYNIIGKGTTAGTIPAGTIFATAMRFTT